MLALPASTALAQRYDVHTYTVSDGLPSSEVHGMAQSPDGRVWFAVRSGVVAFDGIAWSHGGVGPAPIERPRFLATDANGVLWAAGLEGATQVARLDGRQWSLIPSAPIAASQGMDFAVRAVGERLRVAVAHVNHPVFLGDGERWAPCSTRQGVGIRADAVEFYDGGLWIGNREGLWRAEAELGAPATLVEVAPDGPVLALAADQTRRGLWIVQDDRVVYWDSKGWRVVAEGDYRVPYSPVRAESDREGGLVWGTVVAAFSFHPQRGVERVGRANGLVADGLTGILIDREGNRWISTLRGVSRIESYRFSSYQREHGLPEDEVTAIVRRADGGMVLGHHGVLTIFQEKPLRIETVTLSAPNLAGRVLQLVEGREGDLWAAVSGVGVARVDAQRRVRWYTAAAGIPDAAFALWNAPGGELWAAVPSAIVRRHGDRFEPVPLPSGAEVPGYVRRLAGGEDGTVYLCSTGGLVRWQGDRWDLLTGSGREAGDVFSVREHAGELWVGSAAGLLREQDGRLVRSTNPSLDLPIYFLEVDHRGRLWLGTDNGVSRWDGNELRNFTVRDGLVGRETNRFACTEDGTGRLWIGTEQGLSIYDPTLDVPAAVAPVVTLLPPRSADGPLLPNRDGILSVPERRVEFPFRAICFSKEGDAPVRFRLAGAEDDWSDPRPAVQGPIRYAHLAAGTYRLELQAQGPTGWGEVATGDWVRVQGPIWARWWFQALAVAALLTVIAGAIALAFQRRFSRALQRDVRERTSALADEKERLALTLTGIVDGVLATDALGRVGIMNPAAERITGWSAADAVGKRVSHVLDFVDTGSPLEGASGAPRVRQLRTRDGLRSVEISVAPLGQGGHRSGAVIAFRDVTDRLRIEVELARAQRLEAVGILAGGIAHDFNNLLMVILGHLSMLDARRDPGTDAQSIEEAKTAALRARSLTQQLLTFAKGGAPVRRAADVGELVRESVSFSLRGTDVTCRLDIPDDVWMVDLDVGQMSQVLNNLVINARQAMPGGGEIRVRAANLQPAPAALDASRAVRIEVEDDGRGIDADVIGRIFEPYFSTKESGSGLGLATAHSIVQKHGGRLTVRSAPGQGATFRIDLPASMAVATAAESRPDETPTGRGRVLVMDDERPVREAVLRMVRGLGYDVEAAGDGVAAVERYRDAMELGVRFDAVIMDLTIAGGLGGRGAAEAIRELDPQARLVVASGYSNDPALANPHGFGFDASIEKPFLIQDLGAVLRDVLEAVRPEPASDPRSLRPEPNG